MRAQNSRSENNEAFGGVASKVSRVLLLLSASMMIAGCASATVDGQNGDGGPDTPDGTSGRCQTGFADCDQDPERTCETHVFSDVDNCGMCGNVCSAPQANVACSDGLCEIVSCEPGFFDTNGEYTDGCETGCNPSSVDEPDPFYVDDNCDGIDGDPTRAIFVSASQGDNGNPGTMAQPVADLNTGIGMADPAGGVDHVYVDEGTYSETVVLASGVSLFGGFSAANGWDRSETYVTIIQATAESSGRVVGVEGTSVTDPTFVRALQIVTVNGGAGVETYGVHCATCPGLILDNNDIIAGDAGSGSVGSTGSTGSNGNPGLDGNNGSCDGSHGTGGARGTSSCGGNHGGKGGNGGNEGCNDGANGDAGIGPGGANGSGGDHDDGGLFGLSARGDPGTSGSAGVGGSNGTAGPAGNGGSVSGGYWESSAGGDGAAGGNGGGGGGGGGGGAQCGALINDGGGNGGGGGGGGGCAGGGGTAGQGGGGSFGVFLVDSLGAEVTNNTITAGNGGDGGRSGDSGPGGGGGLRGVGATRCTSEVGAGGNGGSGGSGGSGGAGGGGAGGPSYAVYLENTDVDLGNNALTFGLPGTGGPSAGNPGADGVAAETN